MVATLLTTERVDLLKTELGLLVEKYGLGSVKEELSKLI